MPNIPPLSKVISNDPEMVDDLPPLEVLSKTFSTLQEETLTVDDMLDIFCWKKRGILNRIIE